jgi:ferredoxin
MHLQSCTNNAPIASAKTPKRDNQCDECGRPNTGNATVVLGFGAFHPECVETCPHGWLWPASVVASGEVSWYCGACAIESGRDEPA